MKFFINTTAFVLMIILALSSCNKEEKSKSLQFDPLVNFHGNDTVVLDMD